MKTPTPPNLLYQRGFLYPLNLLYQRDIRGVLKPLQSSHISEGFHTLKALISVALLHPTTLISLHFLNSRVFHALVYSPYSCVFSLLNN